MLKIEPTAALVMSWALPLYENSVAREFVGQLDLSSGEDLLQKCNSICEWYGEIILNRKYFLKHLIEEEIQSLGPTQVVILAAGMSPLGLELLAEKPLMINNVFEVDRVGMEEKARLIGRFNPEILEKLRCINKDLTSRNLLQELSSAGFEASKNTIIVMEGISYYLSRRAMRDIILQFRSGRKNTFIIEYLQPISDVDACGDKFLEIFSP